MNIRKKFRLALAGVVAFVALLMPATRWTPPPESLRIGPIQYDNMISAPRKIPVTQLGATSPTDVAISFRFVVRQRPSDYGYLMSTSVGSGNGLKVSIDLYGNVYWSASLPNSRKGEYQLVKVSDPRPPGTEHLVKLSINTNLAKVVIQFDGVEVPIIEPRPLKFFDASAVRPVIDFVEVGGTEGHSLNGTITDFKIVFGRSEPGVDLVNVKILLVLLAAGLLISSIGQKESQEI